MPQEVVDALKPEFVTPLVVKRCHEDCEETGGLYEVGAGYFAKLRWERTAGKSLSIKGDISAEDVDAVWSEVTDFEGTTHPANIGDSGKPIFANMKAAAVE